MQKTDGTTGCRARNLYEFSPCAAINVFQTEDAQQVPDNSRAPAELRTSSESLWPPPRAEHRADAIIVQEVKCD